MNAANATQSKGGNKAPATKPAPKKPTAPPSGKAKGKKQPAFDLSSLFAGQGIKAEIKEVRGVHDLYFVFKNEKAKPADPLLSFSNIKFLEERTK
jgi:cytochrome c